MSVCLGCNAPITIRQSSASSTCNQPKVRLFCFFECVCKGVFQFFVSFCWDKGGRSHISGLAIRFGSQTANERRISTYFAESTYFDFEKKKPPSAAFSSIGKPIWLANGKRAADLPYFCRHDLLWFWEKKPPGGMVSRDLPYFCRHTIPHFFLSKFFSRSKRRVSCAKRSG